MLDHWVNMMMFFFLQSSLLMTMMGELRIIEGSLCIKGSIGYVPQQAWIFSGSVKQNIVFGQAFEEDRYDKVIRACCLEQVRICFSFHQDFKLSFFCLSRCLSTL